MLWDSKECCDVRGSYAKVYKGHEIQTEKTVAIKVCSKYSINIEVE